MNSLRGATPLAPESPTAKFLSKYDRTHQFFITHLDRSSLPEKKIAFYPNLIYNALLCALMIWRLGWGSTRQLLRYAQGETVSNIYFIGLVAECYMSKILFNSISEFVTGRMLLRILYGFRPSEIVFRSFRPLPGWDANITPEERETIFRNSLFKAMDRSFLYSNTGSVTYTDYWDLNYPAIFGANEALKRGEIEEKTWELNAWFYQDGQWFVYDPSKLQGQQQANDVLESFKAKLNSLGKGDIVDEWIAKIRDLPPTEEGTPAEDEAFNLLQGILRREGIDITQLA